MYSFFGKGVAVKSKAAAQAEAKAQPGSETEIRLRELRQEIEAKRRAQEARTQEVQETHRKQAAYGRDIIQERPEHAGYATEAERIMGGGTGYHRRVLDWEPLPPPLSGLGDAAATDATAQASLELQEATALVKQIAKDVKAGTALKSELEKAILNLRRKAARVTSLSKELSGYGEAPTWSPLLAIAAIGVVVWLIKTKS